MERNFMEMLAVKFAQGKSVCVGLDTDEEKIPQCVRQKWAKPVTAFNRLMTRAVADLICAFKPNASFYEAEGAQGFEELRTTIRRINFEYPDVPVILDAKRGDIDNTNLGYIRMAFEYLGADAITVHPYLGRQALQPFLDLENKGIIVLCMTSNKGADEFQGLTVIPRSEDERRWELPSGPRGESEPTHMPLYEYVAHAVAKDWNKKKNCAVVVGAPYPTQLKEVRRIVGDMPILIPGIGFQQKGVPIEVQVQQVVEGGKDSRGGGMIINLSRSVLYASAGEDFAEAARAEVQKVHNLVNQFR